jgi:iron complex outermembrane recepter protein
MQTIIFQFTKVFSIIMDRCMQISESIQGLPLIYQTTIVHSCCFGKTKSKAITLNHSTTATLISGILISTSVFSAEKTNLYHIPAQSLNHALVQFAAISGLEMLFTAEMVHDLKSKSVSGTLSPQQALEILLQDTGFTYRFINDHTVTLEPSVKPLSIPLTLDEKPIVLDTIQVYGHAPSSPNSEGLLVDASVSEEPHTYSVNRIRSATKTNTPIKAIPQSIQTVNRSIIDDQQNMTISEALLNVSGVTPRNMMFSPVTEGTLIRGFRSEQLIDGFTQYYNPGDRESTVNIQNIEVLKGSNALLYSGGSGSPVGGIVHLTSKLPKPQVFGEVGFKMGSYAFYEPYFDWNQPINKNALFRLTGEYTHSGSYFDLIETQRFNINPSLSFSNNKSTTFTVQGKVARWQQPEYQGLPATGTVTGNFRIPLKTFIGPANIADSHSQTNAVWASLDHRLNRTWSFNLKTRYASSAFNERTQALIGENLNLTADEPFLQPSSWLLANGELAENQKELSFLGNALAEFALGPSKNHFLVGADHSVLEDSGYRDISATPVGAVDLASPVFSITYRSPGPGIKTQFVKNTTYGGYLQLQSDIYERFHSLLGLRLGGVEIDFRNALLNSSSKTERLAFLPRVGGVFDITDTISLFAGYSEGMRGQPLITFAGDPKPELSKHIEAGIKFDFEGSLTGQLAVYQIDRSQVAIPVAPGSLAFTATGEQRSQGVELDLTWRPHENLNILASFAHTEAKFRESQNGIAAGNTLAWVPENSGRLWVNYRFQQPLLQGLSLGLGVYLRSEAYLSNDNFFKTRGYHSFDAAIAYETNHFKLAATAKNLSDESYFQPYGYFGDGQLGGGRVAPALGPSVYVTGSIKY